MRSLVGIGGVYTNPAIGGTVVLPTGYLYKPLVSWSSVSQVQLSIGTCRSDDDTEDIVVTGVLTADVTATGANGRNVDTAEQANTWYAVCVIKNPTTSAVAAFLINQNDLGAFTYPAGYTVKRQLGWIRNNAASNFLNGRYLGYGHYRVWHYEENRTVVNILTAGGVVNPAWGVVNASNLLPPTCRRMIAIAALKPVGAGSYCNIGINGSALTAPPTHIYVVGAQITNCMPLETNASQQIQYNVQFAGDQLDIYVVGFFEED